MNSKHRQQELMFSCRRLISSHIEFTLYYAWAPQTMFRIIKRICSFMLICFELAARI